MIHDDLTLYDILDLSPTASPQEIRDAYLRSKATFTRDNLALYTMITPDEREESIRKIEEAYLILSDIEKRRQYDHSFGFLESKIALTPEETVLTDSASTSPPPTNLPLTRARADAPLLQAIQMETEWSGTFLRRVREAYEVSLEEMAGITKVTKTYLLAIEEENYARLPAAAYVRGFVTQMAKVLKLPHEKVAMAYLTRYHRAQDKIDKQ